MTKKRRFGRVRQLTSGRWQARYTGPDGIDRPAPETFATKTNTDVWLILKEAEIRTDDWINPDDGKISLSEYAETWIDERPGLGAQDSRAVPVTRASTWRRFSALCPSRTFSPAICGAGASTCWMPR